MNATKNKNNKILHRILILFMAVCIILSCSVDVFAKQIVSTKNIDYRKSLEAKYGYNIIIDDSVKNKDGLLSFFRPATRDVEFQILKDIDSAFSMLPDGFVKESTDFIKLLGVDPVINVIYMPSASDAEIIALAEFGIDYDEVKQKLNAVEITLFCNGDTFIESLMHEFGHQTVFILFLIDRLDEIEKYFNEQNKGFGYNKNYERLYKMKLDSKYYDIYMNEYSSKDFHEDFSQTFASAVMQYRYISSYGNGVRKPIHNKINKISEVLCSEADSLEGTGFLLNCMPDAPAKWAAAGVKKAKEKGIVQWNTHGLNNANLTRYDAALILKPFLYKYVDENTLFKTAKINKKDRIPETFVNDLTDCEDVYLLHHLTIMQVYDERFNPTGLVQRQSAALMLAKAAELFGLSDTEKADLTCNDVDKIPDWAKAYVKYALSMKIMGLDDKGNFNPASYITYQEFYIALLRISDLKEEYNRQNNIKLPETEYYQTLGTGTALSSNGWILYYDESFIKFNGRGKYAWPGSGNNTYEGEWKSGIMNGKGKRTWPNGNTYDGEWKDGALHGKGIFKWKNGDMYDGDWVENKMQGRGKAIFSEYGQYCVYEGEFYDDMVHGKGKMVVTIGITEIILEGEFRNGQLWNGIEYINGRDEIIKVVNGVEQD